MNDAIAPVPELSTIRQSLLSQFSGKDRVLGAQLGAWVRKLLPNPSDLKIQYGGLRKFVATYLHDIVQWKGRHGLDDIYVVAGPQARVGGDSLWRAVPKLPSRDLWGSVTNPSVPAQFAFSPEAQAVFQSLPDAPLNSGYSALKKLDHQDYRKISIGYVGSLSDLAQADREAAELATESGIEFNRWVRSRGKLKDWEQYRVENAINVFIERLQQCGATESVQQDWKKALEDSHNMLRGRRDEARFVNQALVPSQLQQSVYGDVRNVVARAVHYMNEEEVQAIRLPVGAVLRALESLR